MEYSEKNSIKLTINNVDQFSSIVNWCESHISSKYDISFDDILLNTYRFKFADAKDGLVFKLKWS